MVIRTSLDISVRQEKHGKDDRDHIPARKYQRECVRGRNVLVRVVYRRDGNHSGDLNETDLEGVSGADLHAESDITINSERDSVHKFGGIRDESEEGDAEEFLGELSGAVEDDVDDGDEDFGDDSVERGAGEQHGGGFSPAPVRRIVSPSLVFFTRNSSSSTSSSSRCSNCCLARRGHGMVVVVVVVVVVRHGGPRVHTTTMRTGQQVATVDGARHHLTSGPRLGASRGPQMRPFVAGAGEAMRGHMQHLQRLIHLLRRQRPRHP